MKRAFLAMLRTLVFILPLSFCIVSCEGFDLEEIFGNIIKPSEEEYVSVSKKELIYDCQASSAKLIVNSSSDWSADATEDWVTLSPANGVDGDELVVSVSSNHADDSRRAVVTISSGDAIAEVAIIQDAWSTDEPVNSAGYYQVPEEYLDGWDNGVITRDKHYFYIKSDTATNGYIAYMNDSVNSTLGLAMYFDESFNVTKMLFAEGMFRIYRSEDTNKALVSFVDSLGTILFEEEVELSSDQTRSMPLELTRAGGVSVSQVTQGVIDAKNAYDRLGTLGDAVAGDWGSALEGLGTDLAGGLIGGAIIGRLPAAVVGLLIGECFNYLKRKVDKLEEDGVKIMLGSSDVSISEIKRTGIYSYVVKVNVSNLATRPYGQVLNKQRDVKVGLYIRENFRTVTHKYKTSESAMYPIDTDGTIEIPVTVDKANGVYYVAPVLLPYRQYSTGGSTNFLGSIRYGDVKKLEGDVFDIQSVEPGKCSYSSASKDYTFDVEVCASMLCPDDASSWGIDLSVWRYQLSMDDVVSRKVGTIDYPLSSSSYTLKYEGHLPSTYLDESNDCFSLRATPFAVTNEGERVEGAPKSFTVKVSNDLCDDANHVHAVDLGLSVKWACCNVGASVPEGYGGYYAWGETEEKSDYSWSTYKYRYDKDGDGIFEPDDGYQNIGSNISGTSYDVAHVKWGGSWRMPTLGEIKELCNKCSWQWTEVNGIKGQKVTGPNGNSIFLPAAGYRYGSEVYYRGSRGYDWSGTLNEYYRNLAYYLYFGSGSLGWDSSGHCLYGLTVRPVTE